MTNVTYLPVETTLDIPVPRVLEGASKCKEVLVLGWTEDNCLYVASSVADAKKHLLLLELAKRSILDNFDTRLD